MRIRLACRWNSCNYLDFLETKRCCLAFRYKWFLWGELCKPRPSADYAEPGALLLAQWPSSNSLFLQLVKCLLNAPFSHFKYGFVSFGVSIVFSFRRLCTWSMILSLVGWLECPWIVSRPETPVCAIVCIWVDWEQGHCRGTGTWNPEDWACITYFV